MKRTRLSRKTPLRRKNTTRRGLPKPKSENQQLDALMRQIVLYRDNFRCQKCGVNARPGRGGGLEVAHLLPKGQYPALRHELQNVLLLCHRDHMHWWHKNPLEAWEWIAKSKGQGFVDALRLMAQTRSKVDKAGVRMYLEHQLARIEAGIMNGPAREDWPTQPRRN